MKRRANGTFLPVGESLSKKIIGLRISQSRMEKLEKIAALKNTSPTEIAREALSTYVDSFDLSIKSDS